MSNPNFPQTNEFSPQRSHSSSLSLEIKASSPDEEFDLGNEIDNYESSPPEIKQEDSLMTSPRQIPLQQGFLDEEEEEIEGLGLKKTEHLKKIQDKSDEGIIDEHINEHIIADLKDFPSNILEESKENPIIEEKIEIKEKNLIIVEQTEVLKDLNPIIEERNEIPNIPSRLEDPIIELEQEQNLKTQEENPQPSLKDLQIQEENVKIQEEEDLHPMKRKLSVHSSPKLQKKLKKAEYSPKTITFDLEEGETPEEDLFDPDQVIRKKKTLKDDFEPGLLDLEPLLSPEDRLIIETDIPERLQIRTKHQILKKGGPLESSEKQGLELQEEAKWIAERFRDQKHCFPNENTQKKIQKALSFMKIGYYEAIYLSFYKKHELYPEIQLAELWEISDLDEEWDELQLIRSCIEKNLLLLENFMEIPKSIQSFFSLIHDKNTLNHLQDYCVFHLSKYLDSESSQKIIYPEPQAPKEISHKKSAKRVFAYEALQLRLDQFAGQAGLTCEELAENLTNDLKSHKKSMFFKPKFVSVSPEQMAQAYLLRDKALVADTLTVLTSLCRYMASELFQEPLIRQQLQKLYFDSVTISTEPTLKGNKDLDIYHQAYLIKRLNRRPPQEFQDDLWLKMLKSEREGLIKVRVILPWEEDLKNSQKDFNDMKDEIYNRLLKLYIANLADASEAEKTLIIQWNIVRGEVLRIFLIELLYPFFERTLRDQLKDQAENYVVSCCSRRLKELLNTAPYLVPREEDPSGVFRKPKVISAILDSSAKVSFVCVGPYGELIDSLTLRFLALGTPLETQNPSKKEAYEKDLEEFEKFMKKQMPDLVVIACSGLEARKIKQLLENYKEDLVKTHQEGSINQFNVIYGDYVVPGLFAKTRRAELEFKGSSLAVKEGVSLARYAQNPMAEILALWSDKNQENAVFYIPFHPLQNQITLIRLRKEFEKVVLESVNATGVNLNEAIQSPHLSSLLPFVCGLGPRKANKLLEVLSKKKLNTRSQLLSEKLFGKKVYTNCIGFLKVAIEEGDFSGPVKRPDNLDLTRIHPDNYLLANKIAKDALDEDIGSDSQDLVSKIMRSPFKLRELDLEDYANHLASFKGRANMIYVLSFIVEELIFPFRDPRSHPFLYNPKEIFYKLTKESPEAFRPNVLVSAKVAKVFKANLHCKLDNGLLGNIYYLDIFEKKEGNEGLSHFFEEGQLIRAKIKSVDYERFRVELTMRPCDMRPNKNQLKELFPGYWETLSKYFKIKEDEDFPVMPECKRITLRYQPRSLNHEKFKNVSLSGAIEYLTDKPIGEVFQFIYFFKKI